MRIALHTRVRADRIEEYEAAHREAPTELTDAIKAGGVTSWTIWRSGSELFHLLECEDYARLPAERGPVGGLPCGCAEARARSGRCGDGADAAGDPMSEKEEDHPVHGPVVSPASNAPF
ncbi:L-rhamnose mutarotase [Streptomyces sp. CBMA123]|uniref:L-rhamnose mutarotase n=1 Tax=Streptomyces sp. CBMA123 TaxID=1896313 RepID=UPI001661DEAB|nr:L-rhamnose mutarotase [Streptomyces sp. CBMA123]